MEFNFLDVDANKEVDDLITAYLCEFSIKSLIEEEIWILLWLIQKINEL